MEHLEHVISSSNKEKKIDEEIKLDPSQIKKVLLQLIDEKQLRKKSEEKLIKKKKKIDILKIQLLNKQKEIINLEEILKINRMEHQEYINTIEKWKKEKENQIEELNLIIDSKNNKIKNSKNIILESIEEIEKWKNLYFQYLQNPNKNLIEDQKLKIIEMEKKLKYLHQYSKEIVVTDFISDIDDILLKHESSTKSRKNSFPFFPSFPSFSSSTSIRELTKIEKEINEKIKNYSKESSNPTEKIQLEIAELVVRKQKLEYIIKQSEIYKKEILPEIENEIILKRKKLLDHMKDMKVAQLKKQQELKQLEEMENHSSIISDANQRNLIIQKIPKFSIIFSIEKNNSFNDIISLSGPKFDGELQSHEDIMAAESKSLYPWRKDINQKEGDPIADRYEINIFNKGKIIIAALADGCGWGIQSCNAAKKSAHEFVEFMKNLIFQNYKIQQDTHKIVRWMLRALLSAHNEIMKDFNEKSNYSAGTSTIIGGICVPKENEPNKYMFICINLGDCKAYWISIQKKKIIDLTKGNRQNINDARDPGGRLGPYIENKPDLRNLSAYFCECEIGDYILMVSDGIHDNFDAQFHGKQPIDLDIESEKNSWNSVKDKKIAENNKNEWSNKLIYSILSDIFFPSTSSSSPIVVEIVKKLINFTTNLTKNVREFMEENSNKAQPSNYIEYPGKMDHATCLVFKVGEKN